MNPGLLATFPTAPKSPAAWSPLSKMQKEHLEPPCAQGQDVHGEVHMMRTAESAPRGQEVLSPFPDFYTAFLNFSTA